MLLFHYLLGSNFTHDDLASYNAQWVTPIKVHLSGTDMVVHTVPPPASGAILVTILKLMDMLVSNSGVGDNLFYQRLMESFKWAYGAR